MQKPRRWSAAISVCILLLCAVLAAEHFRAAAIAQEKSAAPPESLQTRLERAIEISLMKYPMGTAAVVLDVDSGRIVAQDRRHMGAVLLAAPGSAIKPFTLVALLESGKVTPEEALLCPIDVRVGNRQLNCSHPRMAESMQASTALAYSCNFYFSQLALRLTNDELMRALTRSGVAAATGLAPDEAVGTLRAPTNDEQRQLLALGVENIRVTPLGLATAYRRLALQRKQSQKLSPAQEAVFAGLEASATYGMGALAQTHGLEVAGKTGTAASGAGTQAWFAGFAPAKAPEIVVVVFLQRGRGGLDAAPVAGKIFAAYAAARGAR